ncbi:uncharacterized protein TM35_000221610 [Trypanosoma theileri]|uniref:Uncharacterized protein n=1 Tax=Trypanosoma theileri TaxID=67003 RepID=A0A1X0NRN3_9TRYP|nr:uncharacterized protein TM35_000221610 [Trypanosoma theileri]ORC87362.1 hypothetical protein TM35_000221610 [Trypanosoma theileri]
MRPDETSQGKLPSFPSFPPPPGDPLNNSNNNNNNNNVGNNYYGQSHHQYANSRSSWGEGAPPSASSTVAPLVGLQDAHTQREEYANAAIQSSAEYWVREQARREAVKQVSRTEAGAMLAENSGYNKDKDKDPLEFVTGSPKYMFRVVLLLLIGLFGAIPLMSPFALTVLLTGCVVTYVADFAGYRRGSVLAIIGTTTLFGVALFLSNLHASISSVGPLCMILSIFGLLFTSAMTAFLHFHWLQLSFPELMFVMERCELGITPILVLPSLLSTVTAFVGSRHAPAWFMLVMCALHHYFYEPMDSSFVMQRHRSIGAEETADRETEENDDRDEVVPVPANGKPESVIFTLLLLVLPSVIYLSFQINWMEAWLPNILNTLGMICGPIAYLCWNPRRSLWFLLPTRKTLKSRLENDPLGVQEVVGTYGRPFLILSIVMGLHWAIYRILHSRYRFLFNGVSPPLNGIFLALGMYTGIYAIYLLKKLLDADERGEDTHSSKYIKIRVSLVAAAAISCVFIAITAGLPGSFILLLVLCVTSINFFLMDRVNTGPMVSFTIFSSLLLMWWMYRMFSFIVVDLHVLGESAVIPTPIVAVNVLWCYVLSCIAFTVSFSTNKVPFVIALFAHSLQVAWVEHVLYSQKEENVYPAVLVLFTTAVGVMLASRLYKNETLGISSAAFIAASYIAKIMTFLVEMTGSYYLSESDEHDSKRIHALEIGIVWWAALFMGYVVVLFELEKRKQMKSNNAKRLTILFIISAVVVTLCTARNFQRAVYEFLTQSRLAYSNRIHVVFGTSLVFLSSMIYPFLVRHTIPHSFMNQWKSVVRGVFAIGVILLITQPTRIADSLSVTEYEYVNDISRYFSALGMMLLVLGRFLPMTSIHFLIRACYWFITTGCISVGLSMYLLPVPTFLLFVGVYGFVFFSLLTLDVVHYRKMAPNEGWIIYGVSICFMVYTLVIMGGVDIREYTSGNSLLTWSIYTTGRKRLLSVASVTNLFIAIVLKFRLAGKSLLPSPLPLSSDMVEQAGVVVNYSTVIAVTALTTLNVWCNGNEPGLHVATSLFLLLLVEDGILFTDLERGHFRYFPVLLYSVITLWITLLHDSYVSGHLSLPDRVQQAVWGVVSALPVLPSHISLLMLLWFGKKRGGTPSSGVLFFVALDILCLLLSTRKTVQWMAIVGVCGQSARLFEAQFWKRRLEVML